MKSRLSLWWVLGAFLAVAAAAEDEGEESTKTFDVNYGAASGAQDTGAGISYTVPLTDNLRFSTSTNLSNGAKSEDDSVARNRDTALSVNYDPPSPWRLDVSYSNYSNLYYRPPSADYDEFKTEALNNNVSSTLNYDFTPDLKTNMNLSVSDSYQKVIIVLGDVPPPTSSLTHSFGGGMDYNVTAATAVGLDYTGNFSSSELEVAKMGTWPPRDIKPLRSRKKTHTLGGSLGSNKDITEKLNVNLAFNASDAIGRDTAAPALDTDGLYGSASGAATWNPSSFFSASNNASVNNGHNIYLHKDLYEDVFGERGFDSYDASFQNTTEVTLNPSDTTKLKSTFTYAESQSLRLDENGALPDPTDANQTEAANNCIETPEGTLVSNVDLVLGEDITFHLTHYLRESRPHFLVFPNKDKTTRTDNLDANVGFDWTEDLRVDVATAMGLALTRYADVGTARNGDANDLNVNLSTSFTYDLTKETQLTFKTDIGKSEIVHTYPDTSTADSASINRNFSTSAQHEFGKLFRPSLAFNFGHNNEYYTSDSSSNRRHFLWSAYPVAEITTSDNLTFRFSFSYSDEVVDAMYNPSPEDWERRQSYNTNAGVTYTLAQDLTLTFGSSDSHSVTTRDRLKRHKDLPAESFFNVNAGLSYTF